MKRLGVRNGIAVPCRPDANVFLRKHRPKLWRNLVAQDNTATEPAGGFALLLEQGTALALAQLEVTPAGPCWTVLRGLWN